ncbi:MAG: hypothetical protein HRU15_11510, partial [Planctomycetes bacterium]|nr:hypothetical protein [Planctomycetota bacterium]
MLRTCLRIMLLATLCSAPLLAATKYWIAGSDGNANDDSNWSLSSGGANDTTAPVAGDSVVFDGNGLFNCTWNIAQVTSINIDTAYTGTISQSVATFVTGDFTMVSTTNEWARAGFDLEVDGNITVSGTGRGINDAGGGTTYIGGNWMVTNSQASSQFANSVYFRHSKASPTVAKIHDIDTSISNSKPLLMDVGVNQSIRVVGGNMNSQDINWLGNNVLTDSGLPKWVKVNGPWTNAATNLTVVNTVPERLFFQVSTGATPMDFGSSRVYFTNTISTAGTWTGTHRFEFQWDFTLLNGGVVTCGDLVANSTRPVILNSGSTLNINGDISWGDNANIDAQAGSNINSGGNFVVNPTPSTIKLDGNVTVGVNGGTVNVANASNTSRIENFYLTDGCTINQTANLYVDNVFGPASGNANWTGSGLVLTQAAITNLANITCNADTDGGIELSDSTVATAIGDYGNWTLNGDTKSLSGTGTLSCYRYNCYKTSQNTTVVVTCTGSWNLVCTDQLKIGDTAVTTRGGRFLWHSSGTITCQDLNVNVNDTVQSTNLELNATSGNITATGNYLQDNTTGLVATLATNTINVAGNITINSGSSCDFGSTIINQTGTGNIDNQTAGNTFNNVSCAASGETSTVIGVLQFTGYLSFGGGTFDFDSGYLIVPLIGGTQLTGADTTTFTGTSSLYFRGTTDTLITGANFGARALYYENTAGGTVIMDGDFTYTGTTRAYNSATLDLNGHTIYNGYNYIGFSGSGLHIIWNGGAIVTSSTLNMNHIDGTSGSMSGTGTITSNFQSAQTGTVKLFTGTTYNCNNFLVYAAGTLEPTGGNLTSAGYFNVDGTVITGSAQSNIFCDSIDIDVAATCDFTNIAFTMHGSGSITNSAGAAFSDLTIDDATTGLTTTMQTALDINGDLTLTDGIFDMNSLNISLAGN